MASIEKRPGGKWRVRYREYAGRGAPQRARHFDTQREAKAFASEVDVALRSGSYLTREVRSVTLDECRANFVARSLLNERSRRLVVVALDRCAAILGGGRPLSSIRRSDIEAMVARLSQQYEANTVRGTHQHLRAMMRAAVRTG